MQPEWPYAGRIPEDAVCWYCRRPAQCRHHVYGGALRRVSEENGLWVYLCHGHHNMRTKSVHNDPDMMRELREECQRAYEKEHTRGEFVALIGRNYL